MSHLAMEHNMWSWSLQCLPLIQVWWSTSNEYPHFLWRNKTTIETFWTKKIPSSELFNLNPIFVLWYTFRGDGNSVKLVLPPIKKGAYPKRKEFAPTGSKFFPFRVDPFSERVLCIQETKQEAIKVVSLANDVGKSTECIQPPLNKWHNTGKIVKKKRVKYTTNDTYHSSATAAYIHCKSFSQLFKFPKHKKIH